VRFAQGSVARRLQIAGGWTSQVLRRVPEDSTCAQRNAEARSSLLVLRKNLQRNHFPPDCIVPDL